MDSTIALSLVGYGAGILTAISFFPQVLESYQLKAHNDTADDKDKKDLTISKGFLWIIFAGMFLWFVYGFIVNKTTNSNKGTPMIITNGISVVLALLVIVFTYATVEPTIGVGSKVKQA